MRSSLRQQDTETLLQMTMMCDPICWGGGWVRPGYDQTARRDVCTPMSSSSTRVDGGNDTTAYLSDPHGFAAPPCSLHQPPLTFLNTCFL